MSDPQDWMDDLETWGDSAATVIVHEGTDFELSASQLRAVFVALYEHAERES